MKTTRQPNLNAWPCSKLSSQNVHLLKGRHLKVQTDHNILKWKLTCNLQFRILMIWRLPLSPFNEEVVYSAGGGLLGTRGIFKTFLIIEYSRQLTNKCWSSYVPVLSSTAVSEQLLNEERVSGTAMSKDYFENAIALTRSRTASHTHADDSQDNYFKPNGCVIEAIEPQVLDDEAFPLSSARWSYWMRRSMMNCVKSSWPLKPVVLA